MGLLCLFDITEDLNQITVILWRGKSLEPVRCCRSFGPSTSHPLPDPWLLGCPRNIERAHPLSKGGRKNTDPLERKGTSLCSSDSCERTTDLCSVVVNSSVLFASQILLLTSRDGSVNSRCFCCRGDYTDYNLNLLSLFRWVFYFRISYWAYCSWRTFEGRVSACFSAADFGNTGGSALEHIWKPTSGAISQYRAAMPHSDPLCSSDLFITSPTNPAVPLPWSV